MCTPAAAGARNVTVLYPPVPGKSDDLRSTGMGCFFFLKKLLPDAAAVAAAAET
jgi:hypothetical protein